MATREVRVTTPPAALSSDEDAEDALLKQFESIKLDTKPHFEKIAKPLRDYQRKIVDDLLARFHNARTHGGMDSILVYLPTGGGKTRIAAEVLRDVIASGCRAMFLVNRSTLVDQAEAAFVEAGLGDDLSFIKAGKAMNGAAKLFVATIQTVVRRCKFDDVSTSTEIDEASCSTVDLPDLDVLIVDEAHGSLCESYQQLLLALRKRKFAVLVGLTATPMRLDPTEKLSSVFKVLVKGPSINELISMKFLAPVVVFDAKFKTMEKSSTPATAPDASDDSTGDMCPAGIAHVVNLWKRKASDRLTIAFAVSISHSKALVDAFRTAGISAAHVDGSTNDTERQTIFNKFQNREILILSSVGVLSEGFDVPQVSCVLLCRPTHSKAMYIQQVGRGLRCAPGKPNCIVLDVVGATELHGPVTDGLDVDWEEDASPPVKLTKSKGSKGADQTAGYPGMFRPKSWTCKVENCGAINHIQKRVCGNCGAIKALGDRLVNVESRAPDKVEKPKSSSVRDIAALLGAVKISDGTTAPKPGIARQALGKFIEVPKRSVPPPATDDTSGSVASLSTSGSGAMTPRVDAAGVAQATSDISTSIGIQRSTSVPTPASTTTSGIFQAKEFRAAIGRCKLPLFDLTKARSDWEREFLTSLAGFISDGVPHSYKKTDLRGRNPSAKQLDILNNILTRPARAKAST